MLGTSQLQDARFTKRTVGLMVRREARIAAKPGPVRPWGAGVPQERERVGNDAQFDGGSTYPIGILTRR